MKKILLAIILAAAPAGVFAWEFINMPWEYKFNYDYMGTRNYLPSNAMEIEAQLGARVVVFRALNPGMRDIEAQAGAYMDNLLRQNDSDTLLVYYNDKIRRGVIVLSPALKKAIDPALIDSIQEKLLDTGIGRWYTSDAKVISKALGTILYMARGGKNGEIPSIWEESRYVKIDDPMYKLSYFPPFSDIIKLFHFEPISFIYYFPYVAYFLIVRFFTGVLGGRSFIPLNIVWLTLMVFVFYLLLHRVSIIYPEYVKIMMLLIGFNSPLYFYLFVLYNREIEIAAYNYMYGLTGGFDNRSIFEGKEWGK